MLQALIRYGIRPFRAFGLCLLLITMVVGSRPARAQPPVPSASPQGHDTEAPPLLIFSDGRRIRPPKVIPHDEIATSDGVMTPGSTGTGTLIHTPDSPDQPPVEDIAPVDVSKMDGQDQVGITAVIGTDSRTQVTTTTQYPYRAVVRITSTIGLCTGLMISAHTVATAGHCLYGDYGAGPVWATNIRVYPAQSGSYQPYGSCGAKWAAVASPWQQSFNKDYDYGAIKLDCSIGSNTGTLGLRVTSNPVGWTTSLLGYPGDKADQTGAKGTTQWIDTNTISKALTNQLLYPHDMISGQSGGPLYYRESSVCSCYTTVAINTWNPYGTDPNLNRGTRITQSVYDAMQYWISTN